MWLLWWYILACRLQWLCRATCFKIIIDDHLHVWGWTHWLCIDKLSSSCYIAILFFLYDILMVSLPHPPPLPPGPLVKCANLVLLLFVYSELVWYFCLSCSEIREWTSIRKEDAVSTLQYLQFIHYYKGQYIISLCEEVLQHHNRYHCIGEGRTKTCAFVLPLPIQWYLLWCCK